MEKLKGWIVPILLLAVTVLVSPTLGTVLIVGYMLFMGYRNRSALLSRLGSRSYGKGDFAKALRWYERALGDRNASPSTILSCCLILLKLGNWERAREVYALTEGREDLNEYARGARSTSEALLIWKEGHPAKALQMMETLLPDFQNSTLFASLGALLLSEGKDERALNHCREAYEFNKTHAIIRDNYARALYLNGDREEAAEIWDAMTGGQTAQCEPYYNRALLCLEEGERERAKGLYGKAEAFPLSRISYLTDEEFKRLGERLRDGQEGTP